jgi:hypothetical protein
MNSYFNIHSAQTVINSVSDNGGFYFNVNYSTTPIVGTGNFIAIREDSLNSCFIYSPDGVSWFSGQTTPAISAKDATKTTNRFVIIGQDGGMFDSQARVGSTINVTFGQRFQNAKPWRSVTYSPELDLTVGVAFEEIITTTGATNAVTSTDPNDNAAWILRTTPTRTQGSDVFSKPWHHVKWYSGVSLFIATSYHAFDLANNIMTSPSGTTWTLRNTGSDFVFGYDSCYSPSLGIYLISGGGGGNSVYGGKIMGSTNGTSWTNYFSNTGSINDRNDFIGIDWSEDLGMFLVLYSSKALYATSTNGTAWTVRTLPQIGSYVAWSDANQCFAVTSGDDILISTDGINWTTQTPFPGLSNSRIKWLKD